MGYYMSEYFQNFSHLMNIYIQCTIQNSQTSDWFCCLLYKILKAMNESSNITLELPQEVKDRKINPTFHTSLVRPYIKNSDILFPKRDRKSVV